MKKTKIVATISDLRCDVEFIRPLVEAGVNVVRMNTAHIDEEGITQASIIRVLYRPASLSSWTRRAPSPHDGPRR